MNKQFMVVNGQVIVATENGFREPIPYVDNIEDILLFENEIEYLRKCFIDDSKLLDSKSEERNYRMKSAIKTDAIVSGAAVAASGVCYLFGNSMPELTDSVFFEQLMVSIFGVGVLFGPFLGIMDISFAPSKKIIASYEERTAYEQEMIEILSVELESLKNNTTSNNIEQFKEMVSYPVRDTGAIKYLKDSIRLRDIYGYNQAKIMNLCYRGELSYVLKQEKYDENAIIDFLTFLDSKVRGEEAKGLFK